MLKVKLFGLIYTVSEEAEADRLVELGGKRLDAPKDQESAGDAGRVEPIPADAKLKNLTVEELKDMATGMGIEFDGKILKDDLIALITKQEG